MASQKDYQPVEMEEAVEAQVVAEPVPTVAAVKATALPMIEVVAPATLSEGYTFEADVGDRVITITVVSLACFILGYWIEFFRITLSHTNTTCSQLVIIASWWRRGGTALYGSG